MAGHQGAANSGPSETKHLGKLDLLFVDISVLVYVCDGCQPQCRMYEVTRAAIVKDFLSVIVLYSRLLCTGT